MQSRPTPIPLRTARDVRDYLLGHWRDLMPDLLVPSLRVGPAEFDPRLVHFELADEAGPITHLVFVPLASGEPRLLKGLLPRLRELRGPDTWAGLAVPHMGAVGLRVCREAGIGFVDCSGNVYLRFNQVVVQIGGIRNRFTERKRPRTLFHDKATIALRILLENPGGWVTTRQIAERGGLSLGWVSQVLQQLDEEGYVERKRGGGTRLLQPRKLVNEWLEHYAFEQNLVYPFQLRLGDVHDALDRLRDVAPPLSDGYALTLEAAIAATSSDTEPGAMHLYLPDLAAESETTLDAWCEALDLRPAGHGADCFLIRPTYAHGVFFGAYRSAGLQLVSDLQLYLDVYHYPAATNEGTQAAVARRLNFEVE